jgi:hypothetical protein
MDHHTRGLVDDDEVLVFPENVEWDVLTSFHSGARFRKLDRDTLCYPESVRRFNRLLIDGDSAICNRSLQLCATERRKCLRKKCVQTLTSLVSRHNELLASLLRWFGGHGSALDIE